MRYKKRYTGKTHPATSVAQWQKAFFDQTGPSLRLLCGMLSNAPGLSPSEYVMQIRLNAAKKLLTTTNKLITDIAHETGFYDHSHFIRPFRAATGQTPAAFRKQQRH